jgi:hypothetical protein
LQVALNHTNTGADQRKSWARTPALTRTTHGPLKSEYSRCAEFVRLHDSFPGECLGMAHGVAAGLAHVCVVQ